MRGTPKPPKPAPVLDTGGAPLCSEECPWFKEGSCSHVFAPDPGDSWCRPVVLIVIEQLKWWENHA